MLSRNHIKRKDSSNGGLSKSCRKTRRKNVKRAIKMLDAFRARNFTQVLDFFAPDAVVNFNATSAVVDGNFVIPFAGVQPVDQFLSFVGQFLTNVTVGPSQDIAFSCDFSQVYITVNVSAAARCNSSGPTGSTIITEYVLKFTFNDDRRISRLDISGDIASLTRFFSFRCAV